MNTQENNKLIAEFMGGENYLKDRPNMFCFEPKFNNHTWLTIEEMKYHSSWDWLMPVIRECYSKEHNENDYYEQVYYWLADLDIERTYNAVVEFIKWYNEQKV